MKRKRIPSKILDDFTIACWRLRKSGYTTICLADSFNKDHTTIIYHVRRYERLEKHDIKFKKAIEDFNLLEFIKEFENITDHKTYLP